MKKVQVILALIGTLAAAACSGTGKSEPVKPAAVSAAAPTALPATASSTEEAAVTAEAPSIPTAVPVATVEPTPTELSTAELLPVIEPAPSWNNEVWINTETALPLEDLRGKVVLLEFWTFG